MAEGAAGPAGAFKAVFGKIRAFEKRQRNERPFAERFPELPEYNDLEKLDKAILQGRKTLDAYTKPDRFGRVYADSPIGRIATSSLENQLDQAEARADVLAEAIEVEYPEYTDDELDEQRQEFEFDQRAEAAEDRRIAIENAGRLAPSATERYRTQFRENTPVKVPRRLPDPPTRMPGGRKIGVGGSAAAIVGGIIEIINWGREYFENERNRNKSKGPSKRGVGKPKRAGTAPDEIRVAIERRVEPVITAPAKVENRAESKRREEVGKIKEITVTKQRRALPTIPRTPARLPSLPPIPRPITIDPLRLLDLIGGNRGKAKSSNKKPKTEREERDQLQPARDFQNPRAETKQRQCQEENRTRCYKGFYRERARSTSKKKWTEIDCFSGRELSNG